MMYRHAIDQLPDGFIADPGLAAYCATKGAVHALTHAMVSPAWRMWTRPFGQVRAYAGPRWGQPHCFIWVQVQVDCRRFANISRIHFTDGRMNWDMPNWMSTRSRFKSMALPMPMVMSPKQTQVPRVMP